MTKRRIDNQFPSFDDKAGFNKLLTELAKYNFVDECWCNEAMPHVAKTMPTKEHPDRALRVWMDWENHKFSDLYHNIKEGETYYRFNVHLQGEYGDGETTEFSKDFETIGETIEFVEGFLNDRS